MERLTRGHLQHKVDWLAKLGIKVSLDHHQPGGNKYTWAIESEDGGHRIAWSGRLTIRECLICLCGMIEGAELAKNPASVMDTPQEYKELG